MQRSLAVDEKNTCEGRCDHNSFSDCRCDSECVLYGDCCIDYHSACVQEQTKIISATWIHPMFHICSSIPFTIYSSKTKVYFKLVSRCSISWQDRDVNSRCLSQTDGMPVSDQYGFNFRNVFCAICHYRKLSQLHPWHTVPINSLDCIDNEYKAKLTRGQYFQDSTDEKNAFIIGTRCRQCYEYEACPSNTNATLAEKCQLYKFVDVYCSKHKYKNDYCYLCHNGRSPRCNRRPPIRGPPSSGNSFQNMWQFGPPKPPLHLDTCMSNEVRDPITQICRKTACKPGYKTLSTRCVVSNDTNLHITNNWKCNRQNVIFFFKFDVTGTDDKSRCLNNKLRNKGNIRSLEYNFKPSENTQWTAFDIVYNNVFQLLHDLHVEIKTEIDHVDKIQEIFCGVKDMEMFVTCDKHPDTELNTNCQNNTYTGIPSDFLNVNITSNMDLILYVPEAIYINPMFVFYYEHSSFHIRPTKTIDSVFVCGSPVKESVVDCVFIILNASEYNLRNNGTILVYGSQEFTSDEFFISADNRARVCFDSLEELIGDNTTTAGFFASKLDAVSFVTTCISLFGLLGTLVTYIRFKTLRNIYGQGIMSLSVSLMWSQLFAILSDKLYLPGSACVIFAAMNHYFWLATFTWTTMLALILCYKFGLTKIRHTVEGIKVSIAVQVFGWGIPLVVIGLALSIHFCDCLRVGDFVFYDDVTCWIRAGFVNWIAFGLPVAFSLGINVTLVIITLYKLRKARQFSNRMQHKSVESDRWREAVLFVKVIQMCTGDNQKYVFERVNELQPCKKKLWDDLVVVIDFAPSLQC